MENDIVAPIEGAIRRPPTSDKTPNRSGIKPTRLGVRALLAAVFLAMTGGAEGPTCTGGLGHTGSAPAPKKEEPKVRVNAGFWYDRMVLDPALECNLFNQRCAELHWRATLAEAAPSLDGVHNSLYGAKLFNDLVKCVVIDYDPGGSNFGAGMEFDGELVSYWYTKGASTAEEGFCKPTLDVVKADK